MKILEIIWQDACGADGWESMSLVEKFELAEIKTIGYLVKETKEFITLTMAVDKGNTNYGAYMLIPKVNIKKKRLIR